MGIAKSTHSAPESEPWPAEVRVFMDGLAYVADGAEPTPAELNLAQAAAEAVEGLSPSQLYDVLTPPLCGRHPDRVLQWLRDVGVLGRVLPELDATVAFSQEGGRRHKDVWDHTKTVVRQSVPRSAVRWAAVLHDIGKVPTRRFLPNGQVTFHGHAEVGVRMFRRGPARRIGFPDDERDRIEDLIRFHLRPGQYEPGWTDSAVRRFDRDMGEVLVDLLDLSRADVTSRRPGKRKACLRNISALSQRIDALRELDARPKPLPPGLGNELMRQLSLPPGRHLAVLRTRLAERVESGELQGGAQAQYYVEAVRTLGLLEGVEIEPPRGWADRPDDG
jgi:poly(A) polymerase